MNELRNTIGTSTASPPPIRARIWRPRRRGGTPSAAAVVVGLATRARSATLIGSAGYPDAFPALLHQVEGYAGDLWADGEDARDVIEPDVDRFVNHGRSHRVLQGARVAGRGHWDRLDVVERRGDCG